jgi:hypothetical protein
MSQMLVVATTRVLAWSVVAVISAQSQVYGVDYVCTA